jgi:hypothetical protein
VASLPPGAVVNLSTARISLVRGTAVMGIDWRGIIHNGDAKTNYALGRGDLILVVFP